MEKKVVQIAGYPVTQLNETEYEAENKFQKLDFHFDTGRPEAVEVFVFDSTIPTQGAQDPCVRTFYAADLEEAVIKVMALKRETLFKADTNSVNNAVEKLREISNVLAAIPNADMQTVLFPGWHEGYEEEAEPSIREAARAILASSLSSDEGTNVPLKSVAALLHYIADMMEQ